MSNSSRSNSKNQVLFVLGNTYRRLAESEAQWNRGENAKKVHDWVLYVDILDGDPDLVQRVEFDLHPSFQPRVFTCHSPVQVMLPDGTRVSRFSTRQQSTASFEAKVKLVGRGGAHLLLKHKISFQRAGGVRKKPGVFRESRSRPPLQMVDLSDDHDFGIELELSCAQGSTREQVAQSIRSRSGVSVVAVQSYAQAHEPVPGWKLVHDGSIVCSRNAPNCSKFELVSPILNGNSGLRECADILGVLDDISSISVNKSMGFHVHISVEGLSLASLIKLCQNVVKYEDAMNSFMPPSRRTGSDTSDQYFKSNKAAIGGPNATNAERNRALAACGDVLQLCQLMNPTGRYYKLNLQNLRTGRQPTVEFRQHSATGNYDKVSAWVRFCMALVKNSARLRSPLSLKASRSTEEQFEMLFEYVIKDRALREVYNRRRAELSTRKRTGANRSCCDGCESGGQCSAARHYGRQIRF